MIITVMIITVAVPVVVVVAVVVARVERKFGLSHGTRAPCLSYMILWLILGSSVQGPQREAATRVLSPSALMAKAMRKAMRKGSNTVSHNPGQMALRTQTSGKKWQHRRLPK